MNMNGMDEWQRETNERMAAGNEPGSPAALQAEIARLRKGIQDYLDGDYESARRHRAENVRYKCPHGQHYWETCDGCIDGHFKALLAAAPREG